ncbi:hypothetical protein [Psychromonas sp.]|uniref:IS1096 element passenger TnpR family protein n=1 Tax=Psychromonas sp. TaxID=1884585 RepID=UPI003565E7D3
MKTIWHHVIRLEKVLKKDIELPKVTAGNGICPAEDSGGIWNWDHILKMHNKKSLTDEELEHLEWLGLSPDEPLVPLNKEEINQQLHVTNIYNHKCSSSAGFFTLKRCCTVVFFKLFHYKFADEK